MTPSNIVETGLGLLRLALPLVLAGTLVGCGWLRPPAADAELQEQLPQQFSLYADGAADMDGWWLQFGSNELDELVGIALASNPDLLQVQARLAQAEALQVQTGAARWPSLNLTGAAARNDVQVDNGQMPAQRSGSTSYSLGALSSWELDLWGRVNATARSSVATLEASRQDLEAARISLVAQLVLAWIDCQVSALQLELLDEQILQSEQILELRELMYHKGTATSMELLQERSSLAALLAQRPPTDLALQLAKQQLNLILGRHATSELDLAVELPEVVELATVGIPADLLESRPDLQASGKRLQASQWNIEAARAARLPAISITASGSYGDQDAALFFDNWASNLAANLTLPLFQGGRLKAGVSLAEAQRDERFEQYRAAVLEAVAEVESALVQEQSLRKSLVAQEAQLAASRASWEQARQSTLLGIGDFSTMLSFRTSVLSLERTILQTRSQLLAARVGLYRALGGSQPAGGNENASAGTEAGALEFRSNS